MVTKHLPGWEDRIILSRVTIAVKQLSLKVFTVVCLKPRFYSHWPNALNHCLIFSF